MHHTLLHRGFSLVELSIVLVILGLLTGGILGGQALIHSAELRTITTEYNDYQAAMQLFENKYNALPGDMGNATSFWAGDTEDGNNSGIYNVPSESFRGWQHLALAGIITGQYSGVTGSNSLQDQDFGINAPLSGYSNAGWQLAYTVDNQSGSTTTLWPVNYLNKGYYAFGGDDGAHADGKLLTPEDAWNVDKKIDDGKPGTGTVLAIQVVDCTIAADNTDREGDYNLREEGAECSLLLAH